MKRGRPKGRKNKKVLYKGEEIEKKILKDSGEVILKCNKCKKDRPIFCNDTRIITEEVRKNYICIFCK